MTSVSTSFEPDKIRVLEFDSLMRLRLVESLRYLREAVDERFAVPAEQFEAGIARILGHPMPPDAFAIYYELVFAIDEDELELAGRLFTELLDIPAARAELELIPFQTPDEDRRSRRYVRPVDTDPDQPFAIQPVQSDQFERASERIHQSFALMKECDAALHDEIAALLRAIMIGAGTLDKTARTFDGASAFELWGAILLNAVEAKDIVDMVQTLAHESCHVMLFGYCIDGALVLNPDCDRYPSPLRTDPRPIDGIYHATFVLARMFYASTVICEKSSLDPALIAKAETGRRGFATRFYDGLSTLKNHARYTENGRALMESAEEYMDRNSRHLLDR